MEPESVLPGELRKVERAWVVCVWVGWGCELSTKQKRLGGGEVRWRVARRTMTHVRQKLLEAPPYAADPPVSGHRCLELAPSSLLSLCPDGNVQALTGRFF